jgi:hypothetical protein
MGLSPHSQVALGNEKMPLAPKGRHMAAQGNALGFSQKENAKP